MSERDFWEGYVPEPVKPAQQEPFGYFRYDLRLDAWVQNRAGIQGTPFYTSPPAQRTWVGLTDEEMFEAIRQLYSSDKVARLAVSHSKDEYRAIEAKLKEKNT